METLELLGIALGLGSLAGINLYLTVFLTGLAIRLDFLQLATRFAELEVLGHPAVMTVAFILFVLEFFADKVPWVDSLWDTVHTVVRPAGAVIIALPALGSLDPALEVVGALFAGIAAATTHSAKAGTRLIVNASPEPASNVAVSVAEDVAVAGGVALVAASPTVALFVFGGILMALWATMPRLCRVMKANVFLMWSKLRLPGGRAAEQPLPAKLSAEEDILLAAEMMPERYTVRWAVPCVTGKVRKVPGLASNLFGRLVATAEHDGRVVFLGKRWFRRFATIVDVRGCEIAHEPKFLSENLVVYARDSKKMMTLRFKRGDEHLVDDVVASLRRRAGTTPGVEEANPALEEPEPPSKAAITSAAAADAPRDHPEEKVAPVSDSGDEVEPDDTDDGKIAHLSAFGAAGGGDAATRQAVSASPAKGGQEKKHA